MSPIHVSPNGFLLRTANRVYCLEEGVEHYQASGVALDIIGKSVWEPVIKKR